MANQAEELLSDLLLRWEELYERGQDTPASELAQDHPDLVAELDRRIAVLKATAWLDEPINDDPSAGRLASASPRLPRTLAGRYRLDELIAEGGFAEVYRAYDAQLQRTVAVKVPKPGRLESRDSFLAEARRVARLKHENIVPVHDVGLEGDTCFIVSEHIEGGSLADRLVHRTVTPQEAIRWVTDIADALEYAHLNGIVHLDVKPANLLITTNGRAKLADFGIAKSATKTGEVTPSLGTLRYMSPEQLEGGPTDHRSDIYSLAVVLYELLAGRIPYSSSEPNVLRKEIVLGTNSSWPDAISSDLKRVCEKALNRSPHQRHASASQFAAELRRASDTPKSRSRMPLLMAGVVGLAAFLFAGRFLGGKADNAATPTDASLPEIIAVAKTDLLHKQFPEAEKGFSQILAQDPENADALKSRGFCRLNMKMLDEAVDDLTKADQLSPDDAMTLKYRALAYVGLRDFPKAISDYESVATLMPQAREVREELASVYAIRSHERFENGQFAEAAADMTQAIQFAPDSPINYHRRGACYFQLGEYQKAYDDLTAAIGKEPNKPDHYNNRGQILQRLGRNDEAAADFQMAKELRGQ